MKAPSPRDFEDRADYEAASRRHEEWSESERDFRRDREAEAVMEREPVGVVADLNEDRWEHAWENWRAENFRPEF